MSYIYPGTLTTEVKGTRNEPACTYYDIQVQYDDATWLISKRFSDFDTLREKLSELMSNLPLLPAKTFLRSIDPTFLKERQVQLNKWLADVKRLPAVANSSEFIAFLRVSENVELKELVVPKLIKTIIDPQFGVNDFVYNESQSVMFSACEEAFALSRLDTKLTNIKMPWEKKSAITIPLGSFNCWRLDAAHEWKLNTTLYFDCQVSAVYYEPEKQYVILGLENGHVICYTVDDAFSEFVMSQELIAHTDRVTGLAYHAERDLLISCSRDKTLYLYDLGKRACLSSLSCGTSWLSSMAFDPDHARVFLGTYGQQIIIVDVGKLPPTIIHTLTGHQASVRCVQYQNKDRYLFSGGFDCQTGIWEIQDNITRSRNVGWLVGGPPQKIKSVIYCPRADIVVTGCEDGFLAIWNTAGTLLHVVRAHKYAIVKLQWLDNAFVLLTGSSDGRVKFWQFPGRDEEQKTS